MREPAAGDTGCEQWEHGRKVGLTIHQMRTDYRYSTYDQYLSYLGIPHTHPALLCTHLRYLYNMAMILEAVDQKGPGNK